MCDEPHVFGNAHPAFEQRRNRPHRKVVVRDEQKVAERALPQPLQHAVSRGSHVATEIMFLSLPQAIGEKHFHRYAGLFQCRAGVAPLPARTREPCDRPDFCADAVLHELAVVMACGRRIRAKHARMPAVRRRPHHDIRDIVAVEELLYRSRPRGACLYDDDVRVPQEFMLQSLVVESVAPVVVEAEAHAVDVRLVKRLVERRRKARGPVRRLRTRDNLEHASARYPPRRPRHLAAEARARADKALRDKTRDRGLNDVPAHAA